MPELIASTATAGHYYSVMVLVSHASFDLESGANRTLTARARDPDLRKAIIYGSGGGWFGRAAVDLFRSRPHRAPIRSRGSEHPPWSNCAEEPLATTQWSNLGSMIPSYSREERPL